MFDESLGYTSAGTMAAMVATGEVSPVELVDNALSRIETVNPALNCFCFVWDDEARAAAQRAAEAVTRGDELGCLHGVPIALKDTTPTKGHTTTLGSYTHENWVPDHDGAIADRLQRAGAIVVGKTTTPEFAYSICTESPLWGVTRNPWNLDRTTGGSSGGSGAAVAAGCVPLAEGSDMGGSVRIPAAWCGVTGLKPALGRIPMDVLPALFDTISHHGPLARNVDDTRLFLAAAQGPDERDILSVTTPLDLTRPAPIDVSGRRIALSIDLGSWSVDPAVETAVRNAAAALADAGATVEEVDPAMGHVERDHWNQLWHVFMATYYGHLVDEFGDRMDPNVLALIEAGQALSAVDYKRVEFVRTDLWRRIGPILSSYDAILCPTMASTPISARFEDWTPPQFDDGSYHDPDMTAVWNLISPCPAMSVPCGLDADGLPIGAQLIGPRWREDVLLTIGGAIEAAVPAIGRPPFPAG